MPRSFLYTLPEGARRARCRTLSDHIRHGAPLRPWMLAYAEWLVLDCVIPPTATAKRAKLRGLCHLPVSSGTAKLLESREDFQAYVEALNAGPLEQARAKFVARVPEYIDAHHEALATAREAKDYRAVASISEPVLDRVFPKRSEAAPAAQITVVLTPQQLTGFTNYSAPTVDAEILPDAPAPDAP